MSTLIKVFPATHHSTFFLKSGYMNEKRVIDLMHRLDHYICGRLNQQEIDKLWIEFLREPEWFKIFETDIQLRWLLNTN